MVNKVQIPTIGGLRKKITLGSVSTATTISGLEGQTLTLAQLALLLGTSTAPSSGTSTPAAGGSGSSGGASLVLGPGLSGGGPLVGSVSLRLNAVMPYLRRVQEGPRGRRGAPGQGSTGGGGSGSLTVTDGTHAVASVTQLTLVGAVVSGSSPNATATISGGGGSVVNNFILRRRSEEVRGRRGAPGANGAGGGGGSPWSITDGTNTVTNVTSLAVSGGTVGGSAGAATLAISGGGGSTPIPLTIPDCAFWFDASAINVTTGNALPYLANSVPWMPEPIGTAVSLPGGATVTAAAINGKSALNFSGSSPEYYNLPASAIVNGNAATVFIVANNTFSGNQAFVSGGSGGFEVRTDGGALQILAATVASIAVSSPLPPGAISTPAIFAVSYNASNYVFRSQRTTVGTGTATQSIGPVTSIGYNAANGGDVLSGQVGAILVYNRALSITEIQTVENFLATEFGLNFTASYDAAVLADSPVVYYKLNDTTGTTAVDSGPNSLNGTYSGSAFALAQPAIAYGINTSSEMGISGSNGYVDVPANSVFAFGSGDYAAECWISQQSNGGNQEPVTTGNSALRMLLTGGTLYIIIQGSNQVVSTTTFEPNTAYHVVFSYDSSTTTGNLYVNGALDKSNTVSVSPTSPGDLYIGNLSGVPVHQYSGYISNVALYASQLSLTRVQAHYAAGLAA